MWLFKMKILMKDKFLKYTTLWSVFDKYAVNDTLNQEVCLATDSGPWPGCSKLTTSLVNVSLKFQTLIYQTCQYFLSKKFVKLSLIFSTKNSVYLVIKS